MVCVTRFWFRPRRSKRAIGKMYCEFILVVVKPQCFWRKYFSADYEYR
jgi:hypothetical protein